MKYNNIILIFLINICLFGEADKSIFANNETAQVYYDAGMYEDAINTYKIVLDTKEKLFGNHHLELISTLYALSDVYLFVLPIFEKKNLI